MSASSRYTIRCLVGVATLLMGCGKPQPSVGGFVSGQVLDRDTRQPIPWAFVDARGTLGSATHADSLGRFFWGAPKPLHVGDSLEIIYSAPGYHDLDRKYNLLDGIVVSVDTILLVKD